MNKICNFNKNESGDLLLSGELTFDTAPALYRDAESLLNKGEPLRTIDLAAVEDVDSAGLALLLEWQAQSGQSGENLNIINAPENLLSLARLCEAVDLLQISGRGAD